MADLSNVILGGAPRDWLAPYAEQFAKIGQPAAPAGTVAPRPQPTSGRGGTTVGGAPGGQNAGGAYGGQPSTGRASTGTPQGLGHVVEDPNYHPIPGMDVISPALGVGGTVASVFGVPGVGLINGGSRAYNMVEEDAARAALGKPPLSTWDVVKGLFGFGDAGLGQRITAPANPNIPGVAHAPGSRGETSRNDRQSTHSAPANVKP